MTGERSSKIDRDLIRVLDRLTDTDEVEVLLYPKHVDKAFERLLQTKKSEGILDYNILKLANCVAIKAPKPIILELAARDDVSRVAVNPRFTVN